MALIGGKSHKDVYRNLPTALKRELHSEFAKTFPDFPWLQFSRCALNRQVFGSDEWVTYLPLLEKFNTIWEEQSMTSIIRQIA